MIELQTWVLVISLIGVLLVGGVVGFILARYFFKKQLQKNPPITEQMIRAMYRQMGRPVSEKQIRAIMNSMKNKQ